MKKSKLLKMIMSLALVIAVVFAMGVTAATADDTGVEDKAAAENNEGVVEFVTRLYNVCLGREPDEAGLNEWVRRLESGEMSGAQVAQGFIFSQEMANYLRYDEDPVSDYTKYHFIDKLYNSLLGRPLERDGLMAWINQYHQPGSEYYDSFHALFVGFLDSIEFRDICNSYDIEIGLDKLTPMNMPIQQRPEWATNWSKFISNTPCPLCGAIFNEPAYTNLACDKDPYAEHYQKFKNYHYLICPVYYEIEKSGFFDEDAVSARIDKMRDVYPHGLMEGHEAEICGGLALAITRGVFIDYYRLPYEIHADPSKAKVGDSVSFNYGPQLGAIGHVFKITAINDDGTYTYVESGGGYGVVWDKVREYLPYHMSRFSVNTYIPEVLREIWLGDLPTTPCNFCGRSRNT